MESCRDNAYVETFTHLKLSEVDSDFVLLAFRKGGIKVDQFSE